MKNKKILKTFSIILLVVVALSWLIPGSQLNQSGVLEIDGIKPEGILSIFGSFDIISSYFFQNMLIVLLVGVFYGVVNKTGAYKELVEKIAKNFKKKEYIFLILSILFFILLPALANLYFLMFLFVPFFLHILKELGYKNNVSLLATVGSILIGLSASVSSKLFANAIQATTNPYIWIKVGFLIVSVTLTILYALKFKSEKEKDEDNTMLELAKRTGKKTNTNSKKLSIVLIIVFMFFLLGFVPWSAKFLVSMQNAIMDVTIGKLQIFKALFGLFNPFGSWHTSEFYALLLMSAILISVLYKLSFDEFIDGAIEGVKKFIIPAILVAIMSLVTIFTINSGFIATIINFIVSTGNAALVALGTFISAPFAADPGYVASYNLSVVLSSIKDPNLQHMALITQLTHGISMLLLPTSSILVVGLVYTEKDYKSWIKYIWKLAVMLLILVFISVLISTLI